MTALHVAVTSEDIEAAEGQSRTEWWAWPVKRALEGLAGVDVDIDAGDGIGGTESGCIATIGARDDSAALVVELPPDATAWLDARWEAINERTPGEPFEFSIELPEWLVGLVR
jgi:hypothetical protein